MGVISDCLWLVKRVVKGVWSWPWMSVWSVVNGFRFRYRDQLWPLVILAVLALARWLADGAAPWGVFALSTVAAGLAVFHVRAQLDRPAEWVYAGTCLVSAVSGLTWVSLAGTGHPHLNVASVMVFFALATIWWGHHGIRDGERLSASLTVNRWNKYIRGPLDGTAKGPMAEAEIMGPVPFEHGESYTVRLLPYKQTLAKAQADMQNWASALDVPMENMILERHPDHPKSQRLLRLQIITRSPIEETVWFDYPRVEDGRILLGPHADGIGEAFLRLYTDNSMWSTFILGGTGSGKTRMLEQIAICALSMRNTVVFYMDGQNGASSPTLWKYADWSVGCDGALRMLSALERCALWRQKENTAYGWEGFTPGEERPGIMVVIDEQHRIAPLAPQRFADLVNEIRKLGISLIGADQDSSLDAAFAGKDRLRSGMCGGNSYAMRVKSRIAGNLLPGLDINPADLPLMPGYAVMVAAEGSGGRTAGFRNRYSPNGQEKAKAQAKGQQVSVPTIEEWFERYPNPALDRGSANALGLDYAQRKTRAEAERAALLRLVRGENVEDGPGNPLGALADLANVDVTGHDPMSTDARAEATRVEGEQRVTCAQRIQDLDWSAELDFASVWKQLGPGYVKKMSTVRKALAKLVDDQWLVKDPQTGLFQRTKVKV